MQSSRRSGVVVGVVDGPFNHEFISSVAPRKPISIGGAGGCGTHDHACDHGTFVIGLLAAGPTSSLPGLCPEAILLHYGLFGRGQTEGATIGELAFAIERLVLAGADVINLSLGIEHDAGQADERLGTALNLAVRRQVLVFAAGEPGERSVRSQLLSHPATIAVLSAPSVMPMSSATFGMAGSGIVLAAPGVNVRGYDGMGSRTRMSGASVATAVVSGLVAEAWARHPEISASEIKRRFKDLGSSRFTHPRIIDAQSISDMLAYIDRNRTMDLSTPAPSNTPRSSSLDSNVALAGGPANCSCDGGAECGCLKPGALHVYALGTVDIRFPNQSISEELVLAADGILQQADEDIRSWSFRVLSQPHALYIARQVCWLLTIEGQPSYYLNLDFENDFPALIACLANPRGQDLDLFVGSAEQMAVELCSGLRLPRLRVAQIRSFHHGDLLAWFPPLPQASSSSRTKKLPPGTPDRSALFRILVQSADNMGTGHWRALNFLAVRSPKLYHLYAEMYDNDFVLDGVRIDKSRLSRDRQICDPIFTFRQRGTGFVQRFFVRFDLTDLYPVIVEDLQPFFERNG